jgi:hypothetical protein
LSDESDQEFEVLSKVLDEYAPEIADMWAFRDDVSEAQQIKTGRLHENRILGILLKYHLMGKDKITTSDVENEYKKYFKNIARSTISTYLNMLEKEIVLFKERDGRIVNYFFYETPPYEISPFWFVRNFCIVPPYLIRAKWFGDLYLEAKKLISKWVDTEKLENILENFRFLVGLTALIVLKNRIDKCFLCQFSFRKEYGEMKDAMEMALKDRMDVLPEELSNYLNENYGELPIFGGVIIKLDDDTIRTDIVEKFLEFSEKYNKDLEFQIMVSKRRQELRMRQKDEMLKSLEEEKNKEVNEEEGDTKIPFRIVKK